jgi:hypothetical protein
MFGCVFVAHGQCAVHASAGCTVPAHDDASVSAPGQQQALALSAKQSSLPHFITDDVQLLHCVVVLV